MIHHFDDALCLFIQQFMESGCQWWEVTETATDGVYYCETNDTYYEYDEEWLEVKRKITFYFTDPKNDAADKKKVLEFFTDNFGGNDV